MLLFFADLWPPMRLGVLVCFLLNRALAVLPCGASDQQRQTASLPKTPAVQRLHYLHAHLMCCSRKKRVLCAAVFIRLVSSSIWVHHSLLLACTVVADYQRYCGCVPKSGLTFVTHVLCYPTWGARGKHVGLACGAAVG